MVNRLLTAQLKNWVSQTVSKVFGGSGNFNLIIKEAPRGSMPQSTNGSIIYGHYNPQESTFGMRNGVVMGGTLVIDLNVDDLPKVPQELIALVIMHETLHAYLVVRGGPDLLLQHSTMAQTYRAKMIEGLKELFPTMSDADASALSWEGLQETFEWNMNKLRDYQNMNPNNPTYNILKTLLDYQDNLKGTPSGCQ
jgi:hypothetical protein